jgi:hypothetical protein
MEAKAGDPEKVPGKSWLTVSEELRQANTVSAAKGSLLINGDLTFRIDIRREPPQPEGVGDEYGSTATDR